MIWQSAFAGTYEVLGPSVANNSFGRAKWGLLLASLSAGLALGGIIAMRLRIRRILFVATAVIIIPASIPIGLSFGFNYLILIGFAIASGICLEIFSVFWDVAIQSNIPREYLARVYSYDAFGSILAVPIGLIVVGALSTHVNQISILRWEGLAMALPSAILLFVPEIRNLEKA